MPSPWRSWVRPAPRAPHCTAAHAPPRAADPEWAKRQLLLVMREWYQHPNGQMPAYEWAYDDSNPPVHAFAVLRVFRIDRKRRAEAAAARRGHARRASTDSAGGSLPRVDSGTGSLASGASFRLGEVPVGLDAGSVGSGPLSVSRGPDGSRAGATPRAGAHPLADTGDYAFLERAFHKLLLNFTWWVNKQDSDGQNLFSGGFLGLDNAGVFNRSDPELWKSAAADGATWRKLEQADGTAWMAMFCLNMLEIALELALHNAAYEDIASKFLEHFVTISARISGRGGAGDTGLWDEETGFFYDRLRTSKDGSVPPVPVRLRSFVGLIPLFAVTTVPASTLRALPNFARRLRWFMTHRAALVQGHVRWWGPAPPGGAPEAPGVGPCTVEPRLVDPDTGHVVHSLHSCPVQQFAGWVAGGVGAGGDAAGLARLGTVLLSMVTPGQLQRLLGRLTDEEQFLSPFGLRSLSREYAAAPFSFTHGSFSASVAYEAAESSSPMFGGNSSWRGPVWAPVNYLMIESLQKFDHFFQDAVTVPLVPCTAPPGTPPHDATLWEVAHDISLRFIKLFRMPAEGGDVEARRVLDPATGDVVLTPGRPAHGLDALFAEHPALRDKVFFYEYFNGDNGAGLGASHQTGWTALVAKLLQQVASGPRYGEEAQ